MIWKLIQKEDNYTDKEYRILYNSLFKDETVHVPFSKKRIKKTVLKLKYVSKSVLSKVRYWRFCGMQFKYWRILKPEIKVKKRFHKENGLNGHIIEERIWDLTDIDSIIHHYKKETLKEYIKSLCYRIIPKEYHSWILYQNIANDISEFETFRLNWLIHEYGKNKSFKCYIPYFREIRIENRHYNTVGIIDTIYKMPDGTYKMLDYKFGKVKYSQIVPEPKYDYYNEEYIKYALEDIKFELGEYKYFVYRNGYKVNKKNRLKKLPDIDITHGCILYIRDWKSTFIFYPINRRCKELAEETFDKYKRIVDKTLFNRRISNDCFYCDYLPYCVKSKKWKRIENKMRSDFKNAFKYVK